jgi:hypothetical protein
LRKRKSNALQLGVYLMRLDAMRFRAVEYVTRHPSSAARQSWGDSDSAQTLFNAR